ncbi:hypothetical protein [Pseudoalteromonas piscicida]|uniref:hypothetical protein n=1 Tax=Pseudoalteromonas piscicida TaxID=43662 RepID=UPI0030A8EEE1
MRSHRLYILLTLSIVILLQGCSVLGKISEATVEAGTISWQAQPLSMRESYPVFIKNTYYTAELMTSDIKTWEIILLSSVPLPNAVNQAYTILSYTQDESKVSQRFNLILKQSDEVEETPFKYRYIFKFPDESVEFFETGKSMRFARQADNFDFYLIQPLFESNKIPVQKTKLEYKLLPEYGSFSVGDLMRKLVYMDDEKWLDFCEDPNYIYDKTTACGQVTIQEN